MKTAAVCLTLIVAIVFAVFAWPRPEPLSADTLALIERRNAIKRDVRAWLKIPLDTRKRVGTALINGQTYTTFSTDKTASLWGNDPYDRILVRHDHILCVADHKIVEAQPRLHATFEYLAEHTFERRESWETFRDGRSFRITYSPRLKNDHVLITSENDTWASVKMR